MDSVSLKVVDKLPDTSVVFVYQRFKGTKRFEDISCQAPSPIHNIRVGGKPLLPVAAVGTLTGTLQLGSLKLDHVLVLPLLTLNLSTSVETPRASSGVSAARSPSDTDLTKSVLVRAPIDGGLCAIKGSNFSP
jgi:hypothetical protein